MWSIQLDMIKNHTVSVVLKVRWCTSKAQDSRVHLCLLDYALRQVHHLREAREAREILTAREKR